MRTLQTFGRDRNQSDLIIAVISIIFGFMLTAIPFPDWLSDWKPNWIGLFAFYWCITAPQKVGVVFCFLTGIFLDVQHGSSLGEHALCLSFLAYFAVTNHRRFILYPSIQQSIVIFFVISLYGLIIANIQRFSSTIAFEWGVLYQALITAIVWPWFQLILGELRRLLTNRV